MSTVVIEPMFHEDADPEAETDCEPRVRLHCSGCERSYTYCHVANATIRAFVARTWRCFACSGAS